MSGIPMGADYHQRGIALLLANKTAVDANPQTDVEYPDWSDRYVNEDKEGDEYDEMKSYCDTGFSMMLVEPKINVDPEGRNWSAWSFVNKELVNEIHTPERQDYSLIFGGYTSTKADTMIIYYANAAADVNNSEHATPRLYCSELMYQAWRSTCLASSETRDKNLPMGGLKFIAIGLITNHGAYTAIQNAVEARRLSDPSMEDGSVTFSSSDEGENLASFRRLVGTDNGRPVARMCADHAKSLGGKQIVRVHAWYDMPHSPGYGALIFELA